MNATAYFLMAALAGTLKLAFVLDRRDARQRRQRIMDVLDAREDFDDTRLRAEFGTTTNECEWQRQQRALHNIARALALPPAKLRAEDAIDFLQNQHWCMNDRLLEFEWFLKRHRAAAPENVKTLKQLVRLLAQLGYKGLS